MEQWSTGKQRGVRGLLLGATPEIATLDWPAQSFLFAADRVSETFHEVFPRDEMCIEHRFLHADWQALPLGAASVDMAFGDGSLTCLPFPAGYRDLSRELGRVVANGGEVVLRIFAAPSEPESVEKVVRDLLGREIPSLDAVKLRLGAALATETGHVPVRDILTAFEACCDHPAELAQQSGWPDGVLATLRTYRNSSMVYSFPQLEDTLGVFEEEFEIDTVTRPEGVLGERCPVVVLSRRS